jgi:Putative MetA-pathway of phenol degradation
MRATRVLATIAFACAAAPALAQGPADPPPIAAGRPGVTESRGTVGDRVLQLEGGILIGVDPDTDTSPRSVTAPAGLVRYGFGERMEVRVGGAGFKYSSQRLGDTRVSTQGGSDLYVGAKLVVLEESRAGVALSVVPGLTLPTGSETLTTNGYDPSFAIALGRVLPLGFDATAMWSEARSTYGSDRHRDTLGSVAIARALTGRLTAVGEVSRLSAWGQSPVWAANTGLAYLISGDMQVDVQLGRGVHNASGWTVAGGIIVRRR